MDFNSDEENADQVTKAIAAIHDAAAGVINIRSALSELEGNEAVDRAIKISRNCSGLALDSSKELLSHYHNFWKKEDQ